MQLATETFGNVLVAHAPEELTDDFVKNFLDALAEPVHAGHVRIVLQMDRTDAFDGAGLSALLDLRDELRMQRGNVVLCGLRDPGRKIFEVTRLDKQFEVFDSVIDAVTRLQS